MPVSTLSQLNETGWKLLNKIYVIFQTQCRLTNYICSYNCNYRDGRALYGSDVYDGSYAQPIWFRYLRCTGTESALHKCIYDPIGYLYNYCYHSDDVGLRCSE